MSRDAFHFTPIGVVRSSLTRLDAAPRQGDETRSPDRPNPIGLHRVTVLQIDGTRLEVAPIEAIDGTPVVDIKPVLEDSTER